MVAHVLQAITWIHMVSVKNLFFKPLPAPMDNTSTLIVDVLPVPAHAKHANHLHNVLHALFQDIQPIPKDNVFQPVVMVSLSDLNNVTQEASTLLAAFHVEFKVDTPVQDNHQPADPMLSQSHQLQPQPQQPQQPQLEQTLEQPLEPHQDLHLLFLKPFINQAALTSTPITSSLL